MTAGCTLCQRIFQGPAPGKLFDVRGTHAPVARYLVSLANHIRDSHAEIAGQVEVSTLQYRGFLLMGYYKVTGDDRYAQERERTRRYLHSSTREVVIANDELRAKAAEITAALDLDISACPDQAENNIYAALVELRDRLCETEPQPAILTV